MESKHDHVSVGGGLAGAMTVGPLDVCGAIR